MDAGWCKECVQVVRWSAPHCVVLIWMLLWWSSTFKTSRQSKHSWMPRTSMPADGRPRKALIASKENFFRMFGTLTLRWQTSPLVPNSLLIAANKLGKFFVTGLGQLNYERLAGVQLLCLTVSPFSLRLLHVPSLCLVVGVACWWCLVLFVWFLCFACEIPRQLEARWVQCFGTWILLWQNIAWWSRWCCWTSTWRWIHHVAIAGKRTQDLALGKANGSIEWIQ